MEPMIVFLGGTLLARIAGWLGIGALDGWVGALRVGLALMFLLTASAHFQARRRRQLIAMVPPRLPRPGLLITLTGVLEVLGAAGLLIQPVYRAAAGCLAVLLLLLFPANVSAAHRKLQLGPRPVTPIRIRVFMQLAWVAALMFVALG